MTTAREETARLADLLHDEQHALAEFIAALARFDAERRWVELGYGSLFYFLVRELGLSKGAAFYRKTAAELVQRFPEVLAALREGKLCMTGIVELAKVLTPENRDEVLPRFFHLSKAEAREVTAALLPAAAPPLRTVVTAVEANAAARLPGLVAPAVPAGAMDAIPQDDTGAVGWLANLGHANASVPDVASSVTNSPSLAPLPPLLSASASASAPAQASARRRADVEPLTAELARIHVTVPKRLLQKLAAARDALSHSHPGASDDEILELGLDLVVERHRKRRGIGAKPRNRAGAMEAPTAPAVGSARSLATVAGSANDRAPSSDAVPAPGPVAASAPPLPPTRSRHVPAHVWRAVWARDGGRCVWPVHDGKVCGSTSRLQLDHVLGFALGAGTTVDECRLLCAFHQDVSARELYGDGVMDRHTAPKRGDRCSEEVAPYIARPPTTLRVDDAVRCPARNRITASAWRRPRGPGTLDIRRPVVARGSSDECLEARTLEEPHARSQRQSERYGPQAMAVGRCQYCRDGRVSGGRLGALGRAGGRGGSRDPERRDLLLLQGCPDPASVPAREPGRPRLDRSADTSAHPPEGSRSVARRRGAVVCDDRRRSLLVLQEFYLCRALFPSLRASTSRFSSSPPIRARVSWSTCPSA